MVIKIIKVIILSLIVVFIFFLKTPQEYIKKSINFIKDLSFLRKGSSKSIHQKQRKGDNYEGLRKTDGVKDLVEYNSVIKLQRLLPEKLQEYIMSSFKVFRRKDHKKRQVLRPLRAQILSSSYNKEKLEVLLEQEQKQELLQKEEQEQEQESEQVPQQSTLKFLRDRDVFDKKYLIKDFKQSPLSGLRISTSSLSTSYRKKYLRNSSYNKNMVLRSTRRTSGISLIKNNKYLENFTNNDKTLATPFFCASKYLRNQYLLQPKDLIRSLENDWTKDKKSFTKDFEVEENKRVLSKAWRKDKEQKSFSKGSLLSEPTRSTEKHHFSVLNTLEPRSEVLLKAGSALESNVPVRELTLQSFLRTSWGKGVKRRFFVPTSSLRSYNERENCPLDKNLQDQNYMFLSLTQTSSIYKAKNHRKLLSKVSICANNKSFTSTDICTSLTKKTQGNILSQQNRYRQKSRLNTKSGNFILSYLKS